MLAATSHSWAYSKMTPARIATADSLTGSRLDSVTWLAVCVLTVMLAAAFATRPAAAQDASAPEPATAAQQTSTAQQASTAQQTEPVPPLKRAHAHNDYLHTRPLEDALAQGFCSVEADIFLIEGQLLVAHDRPRVTPERNLRDLYLEPLRRRVAEQGGAVYRDGPPFWLLIDIKSEGEVTYAALHELLSGYREMLSGLEDGRWTQRAVTVVISGDRPQAAIAAQSVRYAGIDGRLTDLDSDLPAHLMPMISDNWLLRFVGALQGPLSDSQRVRLQEIVRKAHAKGRIVRFWATPEQESLWQELLAADVDLINTDQLARLRKFLLAHDSPP
jgi:hypothetical protein